MESEETQDYVCESLAISQEESDDMGFCAMCFSELRGVYYWCDNRCSDKALRYIQIASMVIEESGEARTFSLCQRCYSELVQQGKRARKILDDATQDNQEGIQGQWQHESAIQEVVEEVKRSAHTDCGASTLPCVLRKEAWQLGEFQGGMQERRKAL